MLPVKYFVEQESESIVAALGIVSSFAVPLQEVEDREVSGILPLAEIVMDLDPSVPWLMVAVPSTALTQSVPMVSCFVTLVLLPPMLMANVPVP